MLAQIEICLGLAVNLGDFFLNDKPLLSPMLCTPSARHEDTKQIIIFLVSLFLRGDYLPEYNDNIVELSCYPGFI